MSGMRWKGLLVGSGLVLVAVMACGGPSSGSSGFVAGDPSSGGNPPSSVPSGDGTPVPASQVDFSALPDGFPHEVWVSGDGRVLNVRAEEGGCGRAIAQVPEQTARRVVVDLVETRSQPRGQMCAMITRYPVVTATLAEPLGQRQVVLSAQEQRPN